ncbi:MAG: glycogen synthase GlgA [Mariprofundales bacterium]
MQSSISSTAASTVSKNIVFVASEAMPVAKTGGLADVIGALPHALQAEGHKVTVIMPYYNAYMNNAEISTNTFAHKMVFWADNKHFPVTFSTADIAGLRFIFIEQETLFNRPELYGEDGLAYDDNALRFLLFSRAVLELSCLLDAPIDILHCHDWQTAMIPLLLKRQYQHKLELVDTKVIFTIHNLAYQGIFDSSWVKRLSLPVEDFNADGYEFHWQVNFMKAGILAADAITTVSPGYAHEILTPEYGCQLDGFLRVHAAKIHGIVNGLDINNCDPNSDSSLAANFSAKHRKGRKVCKQALQERCGLDIKNNRPLLACVSRFAEQKGIDLIIANIPQWLELNYQIIILGSGDAGIAQALHIQAESKPEQIYIHEGFDAALAQQIYAGSDMFLMPSRFEPCGLSQLMAMRYGCIPVVRATGGLRDTVLDYALSASNATGFAFHLATANALAAAVENAVTVYNRPTAWKRLQGRAMRRDSSWQPSAKRYAQLYESVA